jgi:hypothetical protein
MQRQLKRCFVKKPFVLAENPGLSGERNWGEI